MDISFCQGLLRKQFSKMISVYDKKCYVMIGNNPFISRFILQIKKNIRKLNHTNQLVILYTIRIYSNVLRINLRTNKYFIYQ